MRKHGKRAIIFVLCATMLLSLCSCGTGETSSTSSTASGATSTPSSDGSTSAKDTLVIGYNMDQFTTPWRSTSGSAISLYNIYDTLFTYADDMSVVPQLAESYDLSEDGTEYTIKIHEGVLFHNGEELLAEDVAWSLIYNYENGDSGKNLLTNFETAEALDDYTVKISLTAPFAPFLNCLCSRAAYIADKSHFEAIGGTIEAYEADPIGCGAYKVVGREVGASTTLEAFEDYWQGAAPIKHVTIKYITDANTQMVALESGEVDVMANPPITSLVLLNNPDIEWTTGPSASRVYMNFNVTEGHATSDKNLRKAMQYLLNQEDILIAVNEGYGELADMIIPTGYSARPTDYPVVEMDLDKAKEYLEASSYNGETLRLIVMSGTSNERAANIFQAQCYTLGINIEVSPLDSATVNEAQKSGDYDIMLGNVLSSLVDADILYTYFGETATYDWGEYDAQLAELAEAGRTATSTEERVEAYTELVDIVVEEAFDLSIFYDVTTLAYNKDVGGIHTHMLKMFDCAKFYWKQ